MAPVTLARSHELREFIDSAVAMRDPIGVLSVTIGIEPGAGLGGTPPWEIAVHNDFTKLHRDGLLGRHWRERLDETAARLAALADPVYGGRGRALYVALESEAHREMVLEAPLPTGARVGQVAHVLPLLQALQDGQPSGLIIASKDLVLLFESELGHVSEVDRLELEPWIGDWWPEMKGPSRANPLRGQHAVSQRERYARRVAVAYRRTLHDASVALETLAAERGWRLAAVAGDPHTVDALVDALRRSGASTITRDANLEGLRTDEALRRLESVLRELAAETSLHRVQLILEAAAAEGKAACGLASVLAALNEARVAALVIDPSRTYCGLGELDGIMRTADPSEMPSDLTDVLTVRALSTAAEVHPVHGTAAELLESGDGIAAQLRW